MTTTMQVKWSPQSSAIYIEQVGGRIATRDWRDFCHEVEGMRHLPGVLGARRINGRLWEVEVESIAAWPMVLRRIRLACQYNGVQVVGLPILKVKPLPPPLPRSAVVSQLPRACRDRIEALGYQIRPAWVLLDNEGTLIDYAESRDTDAALMELYIKASDRR